MKIAITSHGQNRTAIVDSRFGRADYFVLYDQESDAWTSLANTQNLTAAHGAGIQAGQLLETMGVNTLITGHVGPKASKILATAKIAIYSFGDFNGTVADALKALLGGKLSSINSPNATTVNDHQ